MTRSLGESHRALATKLELPGDDDSAVRNNGGTMEVINFVPGSLIPLGARFVFFFLFFFPFSSFLFPFFLRGDDKLRRGKS